MTHPQQQPGQGTKKRKRLWIVGRSWGVGRSWVVGGLVAMIVVAVVVVEVIVVTTLVDGGTDSRGPAAQAGGAPGGPLAPGPQGSEVPGPQGDEAPAPQGNEAPAPQGNEAVTVTYEVSGDAERARSITYSADENLNLSQQLGVELPWSTEVPFPGNFPLATLALTAQSGAGPEEITCRILRDDEVISENTSSGPYAVVTCSGG